MSTEATVKGSSSDSDTDMAEDLSTSNGFKEFTTGNGLSDEQNNHVQQCLKSRKVLEEDELLRLSKQVGPEWRQLGNALKFPYTKLDALETEAGGQESDAVHKMLQDWLSWMKEKATVGKLAKALYLNKEWEAILSLNP